ncbi:MAG: RIP metalloprotease RseP [Flavobacteriales bacterium]|nr:RIP metalloprotease RseP [Flavobacteriales bacterium]|tara:strand:- start:9378 stop:10691 length:1314 start_codon:yes stop_codon:yes gene_type:complete
MEILIKASQLLMSLSILVVLHELGHFIPAKMFKTKVEKFYLFFDPWFSVLKKKIGDTEYGVGWLPLGGYVKISGMIDESLDKEQMKKPAEPWEFRAKPTWQRLIIMLGGVTVNFLLGIFIYSMTLYFYGDKYLPNSGVTDGVVCSDFAKDVGFKNGDKIVSVDGENIERFFDINQNMVLRDKAFSVIVEREGGRNEIFIGENFIKHWKNSGKKLLFSPANVGVVSGFSESSNAERAGLLKDDVLFAVEGVKTKYLSDFKTEIQKHKNKTVKVDVLRNNVLYSFPVEVSQKGLIGIMTMSNLNFSVENYSFFASFPAGYNLAMNKLGSYISQFALIFNSENDLAGELGGFGAIGSMFPSTWDWLSFWNLTAFLSLMLAFMNLLPIPALDGGHVLFLLYEMIVGKPAPEKVLEYAQTIGMILLLSLLVYANGNDIIKLF